MYEVHVQVFETRDDGRWREWVWSAKWPVIPRVGERFSADLQVGDETEEAAVCEVSDVEYQDLEQPDWWVSITADLKCDCCGNPVRESPPEHYITRDDLGPQRGPASVAQINAQVKQAQREIE